VLRKRTSSILVLLLPSPYTNGHGNLRRVRNADISVCVLSLSDIKEGVSVPPEVVELVTPNTVILLNKVDLIPADWQEENVDLVRVVGQAHSWRASAVTGDGMKDFVTGLAKVLHSR
jgi:Ni2+-binding GTPase involved in maturation of urease and hydrogenase